METSFRKGRRDDFFITDFSRNNKTNNSINTLNLDAERIYDVYRIMTYKSKLINRNKGDYKNESICRMPNNKNKELYN